MSGALQEGTFLLSAGEYLVSRGPYLLFVALQVIGTYLLLSHRNLMKAMVGLYLFQSGIILFFIILGFRTNATIPIHTEHSPEAAERLINPLPHALMLTAIVVGVATLGVGVAILKRVQAEAVTIEDRPSEETGA